MSFSIEVWMREYQKAVEREFGGRIWLIGLQGSYGRGEATEQSDIDVVLILNSLSAGDLLTYRRLLDALPAREKVCGFVSGKEALFAWEPSDLFQFCHDTTPIVGSLDSVAARIGREDIRRAVRIGACNVYHMCAHNLVHERSTAILRDLYKSAAFTLQAIAFLQTGVYEKQREALRCRLAPADARILEIGKRLKDGEDCRDERFEEYAAVLLEWARGQICAADPASR